MKTMDGTTNECCSRRSDADASKDDLLESMIRGGNASEFYERCRRLPNAKWFLKAAKGLLETKTATTEWLDVRRIISFFALSSTCLTIAKVTLGSEMFRAERTHSW